MSFSAAVATDPTGASLSLAVADFEAEGDLELDIHAGDVLIVGSGEPTSEGWRKAAVLSLEKEKIPALKGWFLLDHGASSTLEGDVGKTERDLVAGWT